MTKTSHSQSRRQAIKLSLTGLAALPLGVLLHPESVCAESPKLEDDEPMARQLGYVHDATKTDTTKFPKRAGADGDSQFCRSCQFFTGEGDAEWGECTIFSGRLVNANGWCNSWFLKSSS